MAASMLFVFSIFSALLSTGITTTTTEPPLRNDGAPEVADYSPTRLQLQFRLLETKVYLLESSLDEKILELRKKDEKIRQMEEIIQGKSNSNTCMKSETEAVKGRKFDAMELTDKFHEKNTEELVNQVIEEIILQNKLKDEPGARARVADEKNIQELKQTVEDIHGKWLSVLHSVAVHLSQFQSYILNYWNECGRPAFDLAIEKALEMKAQLKRWTQVRIETMKSKWIPGLKKQSVEIVAYLELNIQYLAAKTVAFYRLSKSFVAPLVYKAQEMADPHIQEAKKFTKPYIAHFLVVIDEATMVTRTHLANIHIALKPYTKQILPACRKFIEAATFYHYEVQDKLKNNKLTQSFATIELAWLLATALLALPVVVMFKLTSIILSKKANKRNHSSHRYHLVPTRRRLKRTHLEK